jgi:predicted RNase H-like HicB family nuclease
LVDGTEHPMRPFIAFIRRQPKADFHVWFPDLPDCVSGGRTIVEARQNAENALALHCQLLSDTGGLIPRPSFMHELGRNGERPDGLVVLIPPPGLAP